MPITPTYPGVYIEELPVSSHTIEAAPTSITVFVGYSHPFKSGFANGQDLRVDRVFSFAEYERKFGGCFSSGLISQQMPVAVNQFFLNGGSTAYIVALRPKYKVAQNPPWKAAEPPSIIMGGIRFTAREPVDQTKITVDITADSNSTDTADIRISYGTRSEIFRKVKLAESDPFFIDKVIGTAANPVSTLVTVAPDPTNPSYPHYPANFSTDSQPISETESVLGAFNPQHFIDAFKDDGPLDKVPIFNLMAIPDVADNAIWSSALAFCERKRAFLIMDPPENAIADSVQIGSLIPILDFQNSGAVPVSANGALYFPFLKSTDPAGNGPMMVAPSGFVAGIYSKTDQNRGVWKAPAGLETGLKNTTGVVDDGRMTDMQQGTLNQAAVNCLRTFPGSGTVVFGARTIVATNTSFQQWKYVPVRRMALFIEQTLYQNLKWVIFEPSDEPLWVAIRSSIERFMLSLFRQGAFQGSKPSDAFEVKCDATTTTQDDIDNGIVNIIVAFAPLKPAEFVIVKIAQLAGQAQA